MDRPAIVVCLSDPRTMNRVVQHLAARFEVHQLCDPDLLVEELPRQSFKVVVLEFRIACPEDVAFIRELWCQCWGTDTALRVLSVTPSIAQLFTGLPPEHIIRLPGTRADWEQLPQLLRPGAVDGI